MGMNIYKLIYKLKKSWKMAAISAFVIGLLVHMFRFTNVLPVSDALYNFYSTQNMVTSGRWFLSIACGISGYSDLPWLIGLVSVCFMALTAAVIVEVFHMENPVMILLTSGLLVTFPAITATMGYEFTADGYMLAMLLSAISVVLTPIEKTGLKYWKRMALSAVCLCLSCGIYQAYISFGFALAVCYFMVELLEDKHDTKEYFRWIWSQVAIYALALVSYYVIWKVCLRVLNIQASGYHGINTVGSISLPMLLGGVVKCVKSFLLFFVERNVLEFGFSLYGILNTAFLIMLAFGVLVMVWKSGILKRKVHFLLMLLCLISLPFGCYIWYFTSSEVIYHGVMVQAICVLYIFAIVVYDRWLKPSVQNCMLVLLLVIIMHNSITANDYYNLLDQCYERSFATAVEMNTRIHLCDDGNVRYVAFIGNLQSHSDGGYGEKGPLYSLGGKGVVRTLTSPLFLYLYTDFDLAYYRENNIEFPVMELDEDAPVPYNWEFRFPVVDQETRKALAETTEVQDMPIWPAADSVKVIGDTIVIKLS